MNQRKYLMELNKGNYWDNTGTYKLIKDKLEKLIPVEGSVNDTENNPKLERFRLMSNAYYDLFNNGGCNSCRKTAYYFPKTISLAKKYNWDAIYEITEPIMDKAILLAAKEQGIITGDLR
tara:strand:- start:393 stop:752 length:360 start_codon:yes stop_codon:yes gene_type:complete